MIIGFEGLRIDCIIGVLPEERHTPQEILVNLAVQQREGAAELPELLEATIDYVALANIASEMAQLHFFLLENYARGVVETLFSRYPITWAKIKVKKTKAIHGASCAFIEWERGEKR